MHGGELNYAYLWPIMERIRKGRLVKYRIGKFICWKITYFNWRGRKYGGIFGWKIDSLVDDPFTPRKFINMEGRPTFAIIRKIGGA